MNKSKQISEFLEHPVMIGDNVTVRGLGIKNKNDFGCSTQVIDVLDDEQIVVKEHGQQIIVKKEDYQRNTYHIGHDPFSKDDCLSKLIMKSFDIDCILHSIGFVSNSAGLFVEKEVDPKFPLKSVNFNPFVVIDGEEFYFQRKLVWSLEQKQKLITSIYNRWDIGKIVVRKHKWSFYEKSIALGKETFARDVIDGKQRLNALIEFVNNEFCDEHGYYYSDLSDNAKREFLNHNAVIYGEIQEDATDEDTINIFLNLNVAGVRIDDEHIEYVKSIKNKFEK